MQDKLYNGGFAFMEGQYDNDSACQEIRYPPLNRRCVFSTGTNYHEQGAIYDQRRQGMTLKSKCSGTQAPFYRQEVLFDSKGIKTAACSRPVGAGGHCKHTVALLLTWVNDPDSFQEVGATEAAFDKRSKPELMALIQHMLEQRAVPKPISVSLFSQR